MSKRRSITPGVESLEGRVVLNAAHIVNLGALGDSYTEEYRFHPPDRSHAMNWVEILAATRRASFGPYRANWGPPRGGGFAYNWAESGASSTEVVQRELPGLARQMASGRVNDAVLYFGGIDYLNYAQTLAATSTTPPTAGQLDAGVQAVTATASANFDQAVLTLLSANPNARLVVATVPTLRLLPIVRSFGGLPAFGSALTAFETGREAYNDHIRLVAASNPSIALADLDLILSPVADIPGTSFPYDDTNINAVTPGDHPQNLFLADGLHAGTVGQGIIANAILDAYNSAFGTQVPNLGEGQVVRLAVRAAR